MFKVSAALSIKAFLLLLLLLFLAGSPTVSGMSDMDYPLQGPGMLSIPNLPEISSVRRVPLPPELVEQFGRILMKTCVLDCVSNNIRNKLLASIFLFPNLLVRLPAKNLMLFWFS